MPAGNTYESIATQTLGSAAATVTFSSIPSTYTDLVLVVNAAVTTPTEDLQLRFNSDTGTNYSATQLRGSGSAASSTQTSNNTKISWMGYMASSTDGGFTSLIQIQNYSNSTTYKTVLGRGNDASAWVTATVGLWRSTAAINSINVIAGASTFKSGSTFNLFGIKAA